MNIKLLKINTTKHKHQNQFENSNSIGIVDTYK